MKKYMPFVWVLVAIFILAKCTSQTQEPERTLDDQFFEDQAEQAAEDYLMEQNAAELDEYNEEMNDLENIDNCDIKGNVSISGEKIYHVPGGEFYEATNIDLEYGERWFCTEEEAEAAGWRKSLK